MGKTASKSIETIIVSGKAADKQKAFAQALGQIQDKILKQTTDVILRIEPQDITVISAEECCFTERFLFFFLPRIRKFYQVELQVLLEVTRIQTETVTFTLNMQKDPNHLTLPFFKRRKSVKG